MGNNPSILMTHSVTNFVWKAKDRFGRPVVREVPAYTAEESRTILTAEGCTELTLVQDEVMAAGTAGMSDKITVMGEEVRVTAQDKVKHFGKPPATFVNVLWQSIGQSKSILLVVLLIAAYEIHERTPNALIYLGIGLLAWLAFVVCVSLPRIYYARLHMAATWSRWTEVLEIVATLQRINKFHFIKLPAAELGRHRAQALAGLGKLPEALEEYSHYENQPGCPSWLYKAFVANLYATAKQYDAAIEWNLKSIQEKPTATMYLDLANRYARLKKDPVRARTAIAQAEKGTLTEIAIPYDKRCRGIVAYLEGNWATARQELEISLRMMESTPHVPGRVGTISIAKGYLCCVLARQGEHAAAKKNLEGAREYLVATGEDELLAECEQLVGG